MKEHEKIAAKLAEFASKLDLKGHTKLAEEVDDLSMKTIAAAELINESQLTAEPQLTELASGLELPTYNDYKTVNTVDEVLGLVNAGKVLRENVVTSVLAVLLKSSEVDSWAQIKSAEPAKRFEQAIKTAQAHKIIK